MGSTAIEAEVGVVVCGRILHEAGGMHMGHFSKRPSSPLYARVDCCVAGALYRM